MRRRSIRGTEAEISAGAGNSLRPNRNFAVADQGSGDAHEWFNSAAFLAPAAGDLRRCLAQLDRVAGNGVCERGAIADDLVWRDAQFRGRISANNMFNTVQYSGVGTPLTRTRSAR